MAEIRLTPTGQLCWVSDREPSAALAALQKAFEHDWRDGMFTLAAEKTDVAGSASLRYVQTIAGCYLTELCHIPESTDTICRPKNMYIFLYRTGMIWPSTRITFETALWKINYS